MNRQVSLKALNEQKEFYNARYNEGYMKGFAELFEACRLHTIREILNKPEFSQSNPKAILDYGCGEGRYIGILGKFFPQAQVYGSDISDIGIQIAKENNSQARCIRMSDETVDLPDNSADLVLSVEVLEHVRDVEKAVKEIGRVLKPNGQVLITVPCANKYSLEWFFNKLTGGLQPSFDGYGRFATDEPAHLRRLNDDHIRTLFSKCGVDIYKIYHRAHFFTTLINWIKPLRILPTSWRVKLALLDWHWFKNCSNGATLVAIGKKQDTDKLHAV